MRCAKNFPSESLKRKVEFNEVDLSSAHNSSDTQLGSETNIGKRRKKYEAPSADAIIDNGPGRPRFQAGSEVSIGFKGAAELLEGSLVIRKRVLGDEHSHTLWTMHRLALAYGSHGRWDEAAKLHSDTLERRKRVLGDEHPDTLGTMHNLAVEYGNLGRWDEAAKLYSDTLERRKRVLGDEHPDTLLTNDSLAFVYIGKRIHQVNIERYRI